MPADDVLRLRVLEQVAGRAGQDGAGDVGVVVVGGEDEHRRPARLARSADVTPTPSRPGPSRRSHSTTSGWVAPASLERLLAGGGGARRPRRRRPRRAGRAAPSGRRGGRRRCSTRVTADTSSRRNQREPERHRGAAGLRLHLDATPELGEPLAQCPQPVPAAAGPRRRAATGRSPTPSSTMSRCTSSPARASSTLTRRGPGVQPHVGQRALRAAQQRHLDGGGQPGQVGIDGDRPRPRPWPPATSAVSRRRGAAEPARAGVVGRQRHRRPGATRRGSSEAVASICRDRWPAAAGSPARWRRGPAARSRRSPGRGCRGCRGRGAAARRARPPRAATWPSRPRPAAPRRAAGRCSEASCSNSSTPARTARRPPAPRRAGPRTAPTLWPPAMARTVTTTASVTAVSSSEASSGSTGAGQQPQREDHPQEVPGQHHQGHGAQEQQPHPHRPAQRCPAGDVHRQPGDEDRQHSAGQDHDAGQPAPPIQASAVATTSSPTNSERLPHPQPPGRRPARRVVGASVVTPPR